MTSYHTASSHSTSPENEIFCTYCIQSLEPAVKSCLLCEASLCERHLRVHKKTPDHVLSEPITSLEVRKCSVHKQILEYYCTEDAACICALCRLAGEHQGHHVETLGTASEQKKEKLKEVLSKLMMETEEMDRKVHSLQECSNKSQGKAARLRERIIGLFNDIMIQLKDLENNIQTQVSAQEDKLLTSVEDLIQKLEMKKCDLSRKMRHAEELRSMTDPLTVLQKPDTSSYCDDEKSLDKDLHSASDLGVDLISDMVHRLYQVITEINLCIYIQEPEDLSLNINTASNKLCISDDLKTAYWTDIDQNRPESQERFQDYPQVLSSNGFDSGRHYWEVDISGSASWRIGMSYPSSERSGAPSQLGNNGDSWSLIVNVVHSKYDLRHLVDFIQLPDKISGNRIRVYLDYEAGQLSFYELGSPIRHLHTFTDTFTEPIHAALCVWNGHLKIIE